MQYCNILIIITSRSFCGNGATSFGRRYTMPPDKRKSVFKSCNFYFKLTNFICHLNLFGVASDTGSATTVIGQAKKPIG